MQIDNWRALERHPLSAEYADITGRAWAMYVTNLGKFGIVDGRKIVIYEGKVIDGWQLFRACLAANVVPEFRQLKLQDNMTAEEWVETVQDHRRHETQEKAMKRADDRRERVAKARAEGKSLRTIAEEEGVSQETVRNDLKTPGVNPLTPDEKPHEIQGADGKSYFLPETKPEPVLCDRCKRDKRVGNVMVKGCKDCKELRKPAKKADAEIDEKPWVDDVGIPITKDAAAAFKSQDKFDELLSVLRRAKSLYAELADEPGGKYLTRTGVSQNSRSGWRHNGLETCILNVKDCRPSLTICPYQYTEKGEHGSDCVLCHGLGWTRPLGKDEAPQALIEAAKKAHGVS